MKRYGHAISYSHKKLVLETAALADRVVWFHCRRQPLAATTGFAELFARFVQVVLITWQELELQKIRHQSGVRCRLVTDLRGQFRVDLKK